MEINYNPYNTLLQVYIVRAFENIDEEEEKEQSDALVEEGNTHTSKTIKESETVKPKEATKKTRIQKVSNYLHLSQSPKLSNQRKLLRKLDLITKSKKHEMHTSKL